MSIRSKSQKYVHTGHVVEKEFVDDQKGDVDSLEKKQPLDLGPGLEDSSVVDQSNDHVVGHHHGLDADPDLFDNAAH